MCPSVYSVQGSIQWDVWKQAHGARCPEDCSIYTSKCDSDPRSVQIPQQPPLFRCWDPRWAVEFNDRRSAVAWHLYFYQIIDKEKHVIFSLWKIALSIWCMVYTWTTRIFDIEDIICIVYFSAQEHMQAIDVLNEAFKSALDLEFYLE